MDPIFPSDMVGGEPPELFPVGAVVRLRGGGPAMTVVDSKSHEGRRVCEWGNGGIGFYYIESLKDAGEGEGRYVFSGLCNGKEYMEIEVPIKECIGCGAIIPPSNDHGNWVYQEHQIDHNGPYCADCFSLKTETETEALVVERCDLCRFYRVYPAPAMSESGVCRRRAPTNHGIGSIFPETCGDDWVAFKADSLPASHAAVLLVDEKLGPLAIPVVVAEESVTAQSAGPLQSVQIIEQPLPTGCSTVTADREPI